ncbi:hypothetical protein [Streptomyces sp. NPDC056190]|uniref:hypothetical protein n=1 Tax=Streptomyces sp. NPDC056190 TaxID=3345741 RepID=UPI0035DD0184
MPKKPAGPRPRDIELLNALPTEIRNQVERVEALRAGGSATPLALSAEELQTLRSSHTDHEELAVHTIAAAPHAFRRRAVRDRMWRPEENLGLPSRIADLMAPEGRGVGRSK